MTLGILAWERGLKHVRLQYVVLLLLELPVMALALAVTQVRPVQAQAKWWRCEAAGRAKEAEGRLIWPTV